jgi:RNA polymerase sigma-70 factor (ECF subfamily)
MERKTLERIRAGDGDAFASLFHRYKDLVYRTAYLMLGDPYEAEDVLQEVFLRVHRSLHTYRRSGGRSPPGSTGSR